MPHSLTALPIGAPILHFVKALLFGLFHVLIRSISPLLILPDSPGHLSPILLSSPAPLWKENLFFGLELTKTTTTTSFSIQAAESSLIHILWLILKFHTTMHPLLSFCYTSSTIIWTLLIKSQFFSLHFFCLWKAFISKQKEPSIIFKFFIYFASPTW